MKNRPEGTGQIAAEKQVSAPIARSAVQPRPWRRVERYVRGCVLSLMVASSASAATKIVRAGRVVDGSGQVLTNAVIVVDDDRITSIGTAAPPAGAEVIDLSRYTVIPGLIDLHTHMTYFWDPHSGTRPLSQPRRPAGVTTVLAADNARRTLETGVTTVRDLGASGDVDYAMRDLINMGKMVGPRMFVAGQGLSAPRADAAAPDYGQLAETRIAAGSDWVKVYGSRGSYQSVDTTQTLTFAEMKAAVDAAHAKHHPVAIHSYGGAGVKDAVRAGADSIEHGIDLDAETIADMVARGTVWVPTIDHNRYYVDAKDEFGFAPETIPPLRAYIDKNLESTRRAFNAGVKLGMGSDAVYSMFGQNTRELGWFVKAGMTPAQALATATTIPAALLGHARDLGAIAPGYYADLVAVDGDPLADIAVVIDHVRWVMKGGEVVVDHTGSGSGPFGASGASGAGASGASGTSGQALDAAASDVKAFVERFLLHLGDHDMDKVAADLAPKALVIISRERRSTSSGQAVAPGSGQDEWTNIEQTGDEWIAGLRRGTGTFREPLTNIVVTIDSGHLAHVRADFQVLRDGTPQSYGVDHFTLVREPSGWKFAVIAFTSMPTR
ncbi:MAG: amidohydrolase family protein [Acidobacteria bacterium]|nr:amidohydrolase family protein [Acidobacteriota bacterium]